MNDLDRKIAELKGFTNLEMGRPFEREPEDIDDFVIWGHPTGEPGADLNIVGGPWSTSDSKALELVDELAGKGCWMDFSYSPSAKQWYFQVQREGESPRFHAWADTRPEAICRAYIAAVTWMKEKKG